jgi:hypothetical protein
MPMQDKIKAAVNERNCTIGSNSAAAPANHKIQLPTIVSFKFFTGMAVLLHQTQLAHLKQAINSHHK